MKCRIHIVKFCCHLALKNIYSHTVSETAQFCFSDFCICLKKFFFWI
uniref:Uncharacterized protein n=1 Tax=Anguilla anguilla TaxID=7936 RepID=A0A0E9WJP5_ANGAN